MGTTGMHRSGTVFQEGAGRFHKSSSGIHHIIEDYRSFLFHLTNQVHGLRLVGICSSLVDERQACIQSAGVGAGPRNSSSVGGYYYQFISKLFPNMWQENR